MSLEHYLAVREGSRRPRHIVARMTPVDRSPEPWQGHAMGVDVLRQYEPHAIFMPTSLIVDGNLLERKIALADQMLDSCDLCPHHCHVNRNEGETGFCGVASNAAVHWEGILVGEEAELVPSHEVFLSGCTMRCAFCYSHEHIVRPMSGRKMTPLEMAKCVDERQGQGATNVNLVGGEPIVHIAHILKTLRETTTNVPVVWNSNMYATPEAMALLDGVVDLYLGDIHFGNDECARRLGRIPEYLAAITRTFQAAVDSGASVIIRHLVMPGHLECCSRPALEWAARHFPDTLFHLMFQYVPDFHAEGDPVLGRTLTQDEIAEALAMAEEIGVRLYREGGALPEKRPTESVDATGIGECVDILVHPDGRVGFTRLLETLVPVASAISRNNKEDWIASHSRNRTATAP